MKQTNRTKGIQVVRYISYRLVSPSVFALEDPGHRLAAGLLEVPSRSHKQAGDAVCVCCGPKLWYTPPGIRETGSLMFSRQSLKDFSTLAYACLLPFKSSFTSVIPAVC